MDSSSSSTMPNSSAAAEAPEFVTAGNALLPAFQRYHFSESGNRVRIFHTVYNEYISIERLLWESTEVHTHCQELYPELGEEMEKKVVCYLLGRAFIGPTLKVLISSPSWLEPVCVGLKANPGQVNLHIHLHGSNVLMVESLQHIAPMLERSSCTRGLKISSSDMAVGYGSYIAEAIRTNKLHELDISDIGADVRAVRRVPDDSLSNMDENEECKQVAEALIRNTSINVLRVKALSPVVNSFVSRNSKAANRAVKHLTLVFAIGTSTDFSDLKDVLATNPALLSIRLLNADLSQGVGMQIVDSLKTNTILQVLDIGGSSGWIDSAFLTALLNLVRTHCTQITDFGFNDLPQDVVGDNDILKEALPALNEQLRLNTEYGQVLRNKPKGPPRSARVVFCGPGYAGKTTVCKAMMRKQSWLRRRFSLFLQKNPRVWRFLFGPDADKELDNRTRGVDMYVWKDRQDLRISLWDFAGQKEYYALHDYLFPNVNSANLFLFFFSLIPSPFETKASGQDVDAFARVLDIETELLFWLRFLCSNSKEVIDPKPRVRVVLTSLDRVAPATHLQWRFRIDAFFERFKTQFKNRLELLRPTIFLNAYSEEMITAVEAQIMDDFTDMVPKLEPSYTICEDVRRKLGERMRITPVIRVDEYDQICLQVDRDMLRSYQTRQAVASYLHNVGEIIYFKNLDFIVIDPRWLGVGVLGSLLHVFGRKTEEKSKGVIGLFQKFSRSCDKIYLVNGFLNGEGLKALLVNSLHSVTHSTGMGPDDLIELLTALEICYKDDVRKGYLIPAALDDEEEKATRGCRPLSWPPVARASTYTFIGRRLQCADQDLTVLTPGFFPRLQVVLRKHLVDQRIIGEQGFGGFEVDRNLLRFEHNAMDVIIEYAEGEQFRGTFVDVLVRTSRDHTSTVDFIGKHVLNVIRKFCAQPEGNQGVILVEGIIRPKSVEHLVLCKFRKNQAVLISELEEHLKEEVSFQIRWNAVPHYPRMPDILGQREEDYALDAIKGEGFFDKIMRSQSLEVQGMSGVLEQLKEPLTGILKRPVRERGLVDIPKLVYVFEDNFVFRSSDAQSEVRLRLHLGCERINSPHAVKDQRGRPFVVEDQIRQTLIPLVQWTYKMLKLTGTAVAKSVPFLGAVEVGVGMLPAQVPTLPPGFFDNKTLERIGKSERQEIVRYHQEILNASPCCEWLITFLDVQENEKKFLDDFNLRKVRYKETQEIAFLCETCYIEGHSTNVLQLP